MKRLTIAMLLVSLVAPTATFARGRTKTMAESGHVVHSRRAGVIMHRMVPPFHGVHVYQGGRRGASVAGSAEYRGS